MLIEYYEHVSVTIELQMIEIVVRGKSWRKWREWVTPQMRKYGDI